MKHLCRLFAAITLSLVSFGAYAQTAQLDTGSADSPPMPENLGMDATSIVDLGWDWSLPQDTTQPTVLKRIVPHKGQISSVVDIQLKPVLPLAVVNPPDPPTRPLVDSAQPPVELKPPPPDPLTGIPQ